MDSFFRRSCIGRSRFTCLRRRYLHAKESSSSSGVSGIGSTSGGGSSSSSGAGDGRVSFEEMCRRRREQAARSMMVQVRSATMVNALHSYLAQFEPVARIYQTVVRKKNYCLVEMRSQQALERVLECVTHPENAQPVTSPLLCLDDSVLTAPPATTAPPTTAPLATTTPTTSPAAAHASSLSHHSSTLIVAHQPPASQEQLTSQLSQCETLEQQIMMHHSVSALSELGSRLRFLHCQLLERAVAGVLAGMQVRPFGSSVNGFGVSTCDVDMILMSSRNTHKAQLSSLRFRGVDYVGHRRVATQRLLTSVSLLLTSLMPGNVDVRKILSARVPILKYSNEITGIDSDLCLETDGLRMTALLYTWCQLDRRVAPLVMAVRRWASLVGVTRAVNGCSGLSANISNFGLTLLVIFYLQRCSPPVLPPAALLLHPEEAEDRCSSAAAAGGVAVAEPVGWPSLASSANTDSVADLFAGWLHFFADSGHLARSMSVLTGEWETRNGGGSGSGGGGRDHRCSMYVQNPLDVSLNVCRNVNQHGQRQLVDEAANSCRLLQQRHQWRHVLTRDTMCARHHHYYSGGGGGGGGGATWHSLPPIDVLMAEPDEDTDGGQLMVPLPITQPNVFVRQQQQQQQQATITTARGWGSSHHGRHYRHNNHANSSGSSGSSGSDLPPRSARRKRKV